MDVEVRIRKTRKKAEVLSRFRGWIGGLATESEKQQLDVLCAPLLMSLIIRVVDIFDSKLS